MTTGIRHRCYVHIGLWFCSVKFLWTQMGCRILLAFLGNSLWFRFCWRGTIKGVWPQEYSPSFWVRKLEVCQQGHSMGREDYFRTGFQSIEYFEKVHGFSMEIEVKWWWPEEVHGHLDGLLSSLLFNHLNQGSLPKVASVAFENRRKVVKKVWKKFQNNLSLSVD